MTERLNKSKENVSSMFDSIAPKYDFLNHFLSMGIDKRWRKKVRKLLAYKKDAVILDVATGTGDLAIELHKNKPLRVVGIDISEKMVEVGKAKVIAKKLDNVIDLQTGDSLDIKFDANTFDAVTCAFGVRNFENLEKGLSEIFRVLKTNSKIVVLEFSKPNNKVFGGIYKFYFTKILPFVGRMISKNDFAYKYLPMSVDKFPYGKEFLDILQKVGFCETKTKKLAAGIASIYCGVKK
ncbi:MAG: bifunctional demethylmenaquinone methyltransferase/2-methoxy-6-polyprenyl-1,4-benzoquinol methylase UbiE [Bacteroidales bacterium]|nr:bifunctional demethylmenaquinone methyltransferase/2-methoxy-6-polyprenyl-1,4-benzoquinol methylase UbiE [Bacteroidales bacterium]